MKNEIKNTMIVMIVALTLGKIEAKGFVHQSLSNI